MNEMRSDSTAFAQWAEKHPLAFKTIIVIATAILFFAYRTTMGWIEPWFPIWLLPAVVLVGGFALLLRRTRISVPQDEPETLLFWAILSVVFGGLSLASILISE